MRPNPSHPDATARLAQLFSAMSIHDEVSVRNEANIERVDLDSIELPELDIANHAPSRDDATSWQAEGQRRHR